MNDQRTLPDVIKFYYVPTLYYINLRTNLWLFIDIYNNNNIRLVRIIDLHVMVDFS